MTVIVPGDPRRRLTYEDGIPYLEALQFNLRGSYFWATRPLE